MSSTMDVDESESPNGGNHLSMRKSSKIRREPASTTCGTNGDPDDKEEADDFFETKCKWTDCGVEFKTQDVLVDVSLKFRVFLGGLFVFDMSDLNF